MDLVLLASRPECPTCILARIIPTQIICDNPVTQYQSFRSLSPGPQSIIKPRNVRILSPEGLRIYRRDTSATNLGYFLRLAFSLSPPLYSVVISPILCHSYTLSLDTAVPT